MNHSLTKEVHHKAIIVAIYVGGRVGLELNSDVSHGCIELEVWPCPAVLTQDVGCEVITIVEGQQVILPQMETRIHIQKVTALRPNDLN